MAVIGVSQTRSDSSAYEHSTLIGKSNAPRAPVHPPSSSSVQPSPLLPLSRSVLSFCTSTPIVGTRDTRADHTAADATGDVQLFFGFLFARAASRERERPIRRTAFSLSRFSFLFFSFFSFSFPSSDCALIIPRYTGRFLSPFPAAAAANRYRARTSGK